MNIEEIISLWNRSKYKTLMLKSLPSINHLGELNLGIGVYTKGQTILCGGSYNVEDYLMKIYEDSIFMLEEVEDYICFKMIIRKR